MEREKEKRISIIKAGLFPRVGAAFVHYLSIDSLFPFPFCVFRIMNVGDQETRGTNEGTSLLMLSSFITFQKLWKSQHEMLFVSY